MSIATLVSWWSQREPQKGARFFLGAILQKVFVSCKVALGQNIVGADHQNQTLGGFKLFASLPPTLTKQQGEDQKQTLGWPKPFEPNRTKEPEPKVLAKRERASATANSLAGFRVGLCSPEYQPPSNGSSGSGFPWTLYKNQGTNPSYLPRGS